MSRAALDGTPQKLWRSTFVAREALRSRCIFWLTVIAIWACFLMLITMRRLSLIGKEEALSSIGRREAIGSIGVRNNATEFLNPVDLLMVPPHRSPDLPDPLRVLRRYMLAHSDEALRRDPHPERRRFSLAYYSCPQQAGNRLHHFWNDLLWAILTNRTVLWKYLDNETCRAFGAVCLLNNTETDCAEVLVRAPWIASYDEWKDIVFKPTSAEQRNNTYEEIPFRIPFHAVAGGARHLPRYPLRDDYEKDFGVDLKRKYPYPLVMFPLVFFKLHQMENRTLQETVLRSAAGQKRARQLFSLGSDFLYGMLHRFTFDFAPTIRDSVPSYLKQYRSEFYTIGLHSRHRYASIDGCDVGRELRCIQQILDQRTDGRPVRVGIMSDRSCTVQNLTVALQLRNLSVFSARHDQTSSGIKSEHGPYAGVGFYQDLAVVSTAQSAVIGERRSSSDVLRELIIFNELMAQWKSGRGARSMVDSCILPRWLAPESFTIEPL